VPKEYRIDGMPKEIEDLWQQGICLAEGGWRASMHDISLPHTKYALAGLLQSWRRPSARPNLARYVRRALTARAGRRTS